MSQKLKFSVTNFAFLDEIFCDKKKIFRQPKIQDGPLPFRLPHYSGSSGSKLAVGGLYVLTN